MLVTDLTPQEEIRKLRRQWQHSTDALKDATDMPEEEAKEHLALQAYIEIRIKNLKKKII